MTLSLVISEHVNAPRIAHLSLARVDYIWRKPSGGNYAYFTPRKTPGWCGYITFSVFVCVCRVCMCVCVCYKNRWQCSTGAWMHKYLVSNSIITQSQFFFTRTHFLAGPGSCALANGPEGNQGEWFCSSRKGHPHVCWGSEMMSLYTRSLIKWLQSCFQAS